MIITLECNHLMTSNKNQVTCFKMVAQGDTDKNDKPLK